MTQVYYWIIAAAVLLLLLILIAIDCAKLFTMTWLYRLIKIYKLNKRLRKHPEMLVNGRRVFEIEQAILCGKGRPWERSRWYKRWASRQIQILLEKNPDRKAEYNAAKLDKEAGSNEA